MQIFESITQLSKLMSVSKGSPETLAKVEALIANIQDKYREMESDFNDQKILYETTLEHSTEIENELSIKNDQITLMMEQMKKYLSSQLYDLIVHGKVSNDTTQNRRKKLSIFFSDIVGFTDLTDSVEPELLASLLNEYLDKMSKIAQKFGGTIDKYIGDAIMVYFGDSDNANDKEEAQKCVLMALEMQSSMQAIRDSWKEQGISHHLQIRIGINTGFCTIGNFGSNERMDYTIIGGQVNAAARLEHLSDLGGIMVSGSTFLLVSELVEAELRGHIQVKGIQHPIEVYQIQGRKDATVAAKTYIKENKEGFDLYPINFRTHKTSALERKEYAAALKKALELLQLAPEIAPKSLLDK